MFVFNKIGSFVRDNVAATVAEDVKTKVGDLCEKKFEGDLKKAYDYYAGPGGIDQTQMKKILGDAGVSTPLASNDEIATKCIDRFDADHTGKVSWKEFSDSIK